VTDERAAGEPAAHLFERLAQEAVDLDRHRRQLADGNEELDEFLLDIEATAVDQIRGTVQDWLSSSYEDLAGPSIRDRVQRGMRRLGLRTRHGRRKVKGPRLRVVHGSVVDKSEDEAGTPPADTTGTGDRSS
jgi:hypothetical protein